MFEVIVSYRCEVECNKGIYLLNIGDMEYSVFIFSFFVVMNLYFN